ncbi:MAG: DUF3014 domain-containing protein [Betaproteobacteria bacterium]|nr:DUF3014 domain-containing protein [Betaproteobacteria bacterium]
MNVMQRRTIIGIGALILVAAGFYAWYAFRESPPIPAPVAQGPVSKPLAETTPTMNYPIELPAAPVGVPLPSLDLSDKEVGDSLALLFGWKSLPTLIYPGKMIRRFVATIDNLPRQFAPARMWPVRPVTGAFVVIKTDTGLVISPNNAARYAPYIKLLQSVDVHGLVDWYVRYYPLFQQAYQELGYPTGYFNNRLIETLDNLLDAPEVSAPVRVVQPKVLSEFSDPALEKLSAGQKIMIRMGSENSARAKASLRAIRSEVMRRVSVK